MLMSSIISYLTSKNIFSENLIIRKFFLFHFLKYSHFTSMIQLYTRSTKLHFSVGTKMFIDLRCKSKRTISLPCKLNKN